MVLLILAGGLGSRYGGEKQFDGIGSKGEYLMEYNIYDAITVGFQEVVIVTNEGSNQILFKYLRARLPENIRLACVPQRIDDLPVLFETD